MKQSGRAVLVWSLAFYALAALAVNLVVDRYPSKEEALYRTKLERLQEAVRERPDHSLVLMLGSSRTDAAFQAGRFDGLPGPDGWPVLAFNFGIPAAGPLHEQLYLREVLDLGIRPRLLLVEFLPPLFTRPYRDLISEEKWTSPAWLRASQLIRLCPYFADPSGKISDWIEARVAPWYVHRSALQKWAEAGLTPRSTVRSLVRSTDSFGWRAHEAPTPEERGFYRAMASNYVPSLASFHLGTGPTRAMHDLLECCRSEHIPVVLVVTPESEEFQSWYSPRCQAQTDRLLDDLRRSYGVEVVDTRQLLGKEDFTDGHHAAEDGATLFTTHLLGKVQHLFHSRLVYP
jgi:hypothetical protein